MLRVMTIIGTRSEMIKLDRVMTELDKHTENIIVHISRNYGYELNEIFFQKLQIHRPDYSLNAAGKSAVETIANVIRRSNELMEQMKPDTLLLYGDTNSCISVVSAKRHKISIFHMGAGNRCFNQRVPGEINHKVVDHLSDINISLLEHARKYLIAKGICLETIIKTGSPMTEVLMHHKAEMVKNDVLERENLKEDEYFIVSTHREENIDSEENFFNLPDSLATVVGKYHKRVIVSTHPHARERSESIGFINSNPMIEFMKPLGFMEYIELQRSAFCVISDSGTITEEFSILHFPAITIRQVYRRPEGMDEGTLTMTGLNSDRILESTEAIISQYAEGADVVHSIPDYASDSISKEAVRIILSYTNYINHTVWHEEV